MSKNTYPETSCAWATEIYVDIRYVDKYIIDTHLDALVSPLHDKDLKLHIDEINGHVYESYRLKKPHRHIEFIFPRPVSESTFDYMLKHKIERHGFTCVGRERLYDMVSYARYLAHMDNPEKAQYPKEDIIYYGRARPTILEMYRKNIYDSSEYLQHIIDDIMKHRISNLIDLERYYKVTNPDMLFEVHKNLSKVKEYIRSMYYKNIAIEEGWKRSARIHHDNIRA